MSYFDLNKGDLERTIRAINNSDNLIYIHLTANKYYTYNLFRQLVSTRRIIIGGPLPQTCPELFQEEIIINDELEEEGICKLYNIEHNGHLWEQDCLMPKASCTTFRNETVQSDFSNVILAGRGCLYKCDFCIHSSFHKEVHLRSMVSIKKELDSYNGEKNSIYLADPSVGNHKFYKNILALLSAYKHLSFSMNIRADQITEDFIQIIKKVNIDKLYIGLESFNDLFLSRHHKGETIEKIKAALQKLNDNHIPFHL